MMSLKPTGDIQADLLKFGRMSLKTVQGDEAMCWQRLSLAESRDHPEVGDAIYASGPARVIKAVTEFVSSETEAGRLNCHDAELAAEQFSGLLAGVYPIRVMTGQPRPSKAKLNRRCTEAVNTFLAAFSTEES
jgi:TetR/AcrR family transcriptional repressor of mexJK operon